MFTQSKGMSLCECFRSTNDKGKMGSCSADHCPRAPVKTKYVHLSSSVHYLHIWNGFCDSDDSFVDSVRKCSWENLQFSWHHCMTGLGIFSSKIQQIKYLHHPFNLSSVYVWISLSWMYSFVSCLGEAKDVTEKNRNRRNDLKVRDNLVGSLMR